MNSASPSDTLRQGLHSAGYLADNDLSTALWLAMELQRPLLLEGDAGVGKTSLAQALAKATDSTLVRLQCFEGLDLAQAAYEWNYSRQLMTIRTREASGTKVATTDVFGRDFLLERPLLKAISQEGPCVLLIDEIDRADEAFEAFLLEVLSEYQITVPEIGTIKALHIPQVILTSNDTRELSDALRRRCLYHHLDYPDLAREISIVKLVLPEADGQLVEDSVQFVQLLRGEDLAKTPGIAETLDWIKALHQMNVHTLASDMAPLLVTLGCLLKTKEDHFMVNADRMQQLMEDKRYKGVAVKNTEASLPTS